MDNWRKPNCLCPSYNGRGGNAKTIINDITKLSKNKKASFQKKLTRQEHPQLQHLLKTPHPEQLSSAAPPALTLGNITRSADPHGGRCLPFLEEQYPLVDSAAQAAHFNLCFEDDSHDWCWGHFHHGRERGAKDLAAHHCQLTNHTTNNTHDSSKTNTSVNINNCIMETSHITTMLDLSSAQTTNQQPSPQSHLAHARHPLHYFHFFRYILWRRQWQGKAYTKLTTAILPPLPDQNLQRVAAQYCWHVTLQNFNTVRCMQYFYPTKTKHPTNNNTVRFYQKWKYTHNLLTASFSLLVLSSSSFFPNNLSSLYQLTQHGVRYFEEDIWSKGLKLLTTKNHNKNHDDVKKIVRHPTILCILLGHGQADPHHGTLDFRSQRQFFQNKHGVKTLLKNFWHNNVKGTDLNSSGHSKSCGGHKILKGSNLPFVK